MNPPSTLSGAHLRTFQTIFQHPISHNLQWHDVHAMFRHLGQVEEKANGSLLVSCNGHSIVLPPPRTKDVSETEEVMKLRHFLERTATPASAPTSASTPAAADGLCFVLINHHAIRIFHPETPSAASGQAVLHDPADFFRHLPHSKDFSRGQEKPDPNSFFPPVVQALKSANQILLLGSGTGKSSEMDQFAAWLDAHHPELARRIVGSLVVDEHHLTDDQLLAKARDFYATSQVPLAS